MKFLLIAVNAKYIHSNPAVYSLKAYTGKEYEQDIEIAEYTINNQLENILGDIYKRKPDAAAFSCYIWNWEMICRLIRELHKIMPSLPLWLGGPEVSFDPKKVLEEFPEVTGIMIGEGEKTFSELLKHYHNIRKNPRVELTAGLESIAGIVWRKKAEITVNGQQELTDMDTLPFLYENLADFKNRIIYYESARGCPFRCSYCLSSIDKKVRLRNIEKVKRELQFFLDHKVAQVKFIDRTFNCNHEHTMAVWDYIYRHDNGITNFHFEIAADIMKEEELTLLSQMRPGLVQLEIGVQSANPQTLREINRYTDMNRLKEIVGRIHEGRNVHIHLDLIAGLPYEDYESFGHSFDVVYAMKPEQLQLGFLKVLKGSPMHEKADSYGINYTSMPPYEVLYSKWLNFMDICGLKQIEEMVELYYNSNQFTHTLSILEGVFTSPFSMFEKLAEYYEENGYFINSPSRVYRYEVLLGFACCYDREREALYRELLTYDIYLRENMKSRPSFAKDMQEWKGKIREFYEDEERLRELLPDYGAYQTKQIARMTHMEVFSYPVWEEAAMMCQEKLPEKKMVLFDYSRRNPLTGEARTFIFAL